MPNCFQLFQKNDETNTPLSLNKVDEAICEHLSEPVHPVRWAHGWFDIIGWGIAVRGFALGSKELRDYVVEMTTGTGFRPEFVKIMAKILMFMEANYSSNAFVEIGKR